MSSNVRLIDPATGLAYKAGGSASDPGVVTARNTQSAASATRGFANATIKAKDVANADALMEMIARQFNGTTFDMAAKPNIFARVASSAAAGNPALVKAGSADCVQFWGENAAIKTYLQLYNKATAPTLADTPVLTFPIPANAMFSQAIPNGGGYFPLGLGFAFTTDAAGTTGAAAAAVLAFAMLAV